MEPPAHGGRSARDCPASSQNAASAASHQPPTSSTARQENAATSTRPASPETSTPSENFTCVSRAAQDVTPRSNDRLGLVVADRRAITTVNSATTRVQPAPVNANTAGAATVANTA